MFQSALLRPAFTPMTIALMVLGFVVFWPLGLAILAYILFGDRFGRGHEGKTRGFAGFRSCSTYRRSHPSSSGFGQTGNLAFDAWRRSELDRLEEERRKLDAMRADFDNYLRDLKMAKDREEFDRFMAERKTAKPASGETNGTVIDPSI